MKITENLGVGAHFAQKDDILFGIMSMTGTCTGCGEEVNMLRFGVGFGEIYFTYHAHAPEK